MSTLMSAQISASMRGQRWLCVLAVVVAATGAMPGSSAAFFEAPATIFDRAAQAAGPRVWGAPLLDRDERFGDGPEDRRPVRYYPQGRMEISRPEVGDLGYGRLVAELVSGELAIGHSQRLHYAGADLPVVGDWQRASNDQAPTYRSLRPLLARAPMAVGQPVDAVVLPPEGSGITTAVVASRRDPALGQLAVNAIYLDETGHNVPDVFWRTLLAHGAGGGRDLTWTALYGWPLTDAFWVRAREDGRVADVMVQLFERRTLIFRPAAPADQRVRPGDVGLAYLAWRDGRTNAAPNLSALESRAGLAVPPVAEAGTSFLLAAGGFTDGEQIDAWLETGGAVYPQPNLRLRPGGLFLARLRTTPVTSGALEIRLVVRGRTSGHESYVQIRVLPTDGLTPGAEAAEPTELTGARGDARVAPPLLPVGHLGQVTASGFQPGETITAWVTTGLNRVIPFGTYIATARVVTPPGSARPTARLQADADGRLAALLPAPGFATSGVYRVTLVGDESGQVAVAPFRARAGEPWLTDYTFGVERAPASTGSEDEPLDGLRLIDDAEASIDPAWLPGLTGEGRDGQ